MFLKVDGELIFVDCDSDELAHYGVGHLDGGHSGRYEWGSGKTPFQHPSEFLDKYRELAAQYGKSNKKAIAEEMGLSVGELNVQYSLATNRVKTEQSKRAKDLMAQYNNYSEVGRIMGISDNTVRSLINDQRVENRSRVDTVADLLMAEVDKHKTDEVNGIVDIGKGVAQELGVSKTVLDNAVYACYLQGYEVIKGAVKTGPKQQTTAVYLCSPGTKKGEVYDFNNVHTITEYHSNDGGDSFKKLQPPVSIDSSRVMIRYGDQGGKEKDGVIELRRGVRDIALGRSSYAQVRIGVDGTHYLKGMAVYTDEKMPDGVDIIYNTNKKSGTPKMDVFKPMKTDKDGNIDSDNPFGANIKSFRAGGQHYYEDENGEEKLSVINKVRDEGDWDAYSDSLAAQFLVKQSRDLIQRQLTQTYEEKKAELREISSYTNPTIKKDLLLTYADECDGAAVHLKAAALPRQSWQVILPSTSLKDNEIYAPNYENGEKVALIRYPHGGTFEIPILTVNNGNREMQKVYGQMKDAVAVNTYVANTLSGADYDGDTVLVIPVNDRIHIQSEDRNKDKYLKTLDDFDTKDYAIPYPNTEEGHKEAEAHGYKYMTERYKQNQMGQVSNLITDMTIKGANNEEIVRAVKHSMVVIDSVKHGLDYKRSEKENRIDELKAKYQGHLNENGRFSTGASTIISRAKSPVSVPERKGNSYIDKYWDEEAINPKTGKAGMWIPTETQEGKLYFKESGREYYKIKKKNPSTGKSETLPVYEKNGIYSYKDFDGTYKQVSNTDDLVTVKATQSVPKMLAVDDANELSSGYVKERYYADYANKMKQLANDARLEYTKTDDIEFDKAAKQIYISEYNSLKEKLVKAQSKAPRERQAQRIANSVANAKRDSAVEMSDGEYRKIKQRALEEARVDLGVIGGDFGINITDKEWEAIQSGAIPKSMLQQVLHYTDTTQKKQLAMPRQGSVLPDSVQNRIQGYYNRGYTAAQIAEQLGVSVSTVYKYLSKASE